MLRFSRDNKNFEFNVVYQNILRFFYQILLDFQEKIRILTFSRFFCNFDF